MTRSFTLALPLLLHALPQATAWGAYGHETVAFIAQDFISNSTSAFARKVLSDTSANYLASAATWADTFRTTSAGKFSAPFHFIDAEDSPPKSCGVDYSRDCGKAGCVVSAIANYTQRVTDKTLSKEDVLEAMKFIVHFVGDIHQPLHDEALELGGNGIDVKFAGKTTNLHSIWDTAMPQKLGGGSTIADARTWASNLTSQIRSGKFASKRADWLKGIDGKDAVKTSMVWASDSNGFVCTTVMPDGQAAVESGDLDGAYFNSAAPIIETQIAKAGYRLAAWLNLIVDGKTGLVRRDADIEPIDMHISLPSPLTYRALSPAKLARRAAGYNCGHAH